MTSRQNRAAPAAPPGIRSGSGSRPTQSTESRAFAAARSFSKYVSATIGKLSCDCGSALGGFHLPLPLPHPAVGADLGRRRLAALGALPDRHPLGASDGILAAPQEARQEAVFEARLAFFE